MRSVYTTMKWHLSWPLVLLGVLCSGTLTQIPEISMNTQHFYATQSNVTLHCHVDSTSPYLEIKWTKVECSYYKKSKNISCFGEDEKKISGYGKGKQQLLGYGDGIISFINGHTHDELYKPMEGRVKFTIGHPERDASINITDLQLYDTAVYMCKVKTSFGTDYILVNLTVIDPPTQPQCHVEGSVYEGSTVALTCASSYGTSLRYTWVKTSGDWALPTDAMVDDKGSTLRLRHLSEADFERYFCMVANPMLNTVDTKHCEVVLTPQLTTNMLAAILMATCFTMLIAIIGTFIYVMISISCAVYVAVAGETAGGRSPPHSPVTR
ncbi:uncharacterized protein LOC144055409 [Vanacampus margaritifer]